MAHAERERRHRAVHPRLPYPGPQDSRRFGRAEASQGSSFDWTDALIGAAITAAIMALAIAGSMVARRQGRLQLR